MSCLWLNKILEEILLLSKEDWALQVYKKSNEETTNAGLNQESEFYQDFLLSQFESEIDKFEEKLLLKYFEYLNLSIIGGECFQNDFLSILKKIISNCGNLQYSQIDDDNINEQIRLSLEDKIKEIEPLSILKKCLIEYNSNAKFLLRLVENPSINTLFDLSDQTQDILDELKKNYFLNNNDLKKELLLSVKSNLTLLRKDFFLKYEISDLKILLVSKNDLTNCNKYFQSTPILSSIMELLIEKCTFLIRKFIIRKYREDDVHNENYVFLGKESNFDFISHKLNFEVFKEWDRYSKNHFLSEINQEKIITLNRNSKRILRIGKISALDFHSLTKYFKDLNCDFEKLKLLLDEVESIPIADTNFDKFSINKIKNYISNNIFSESIRKIGNDLNIDEVEKLIDFEIKKIQQIQNETNLNNFFPYYKVCAFLNNYIEENLTKISLESNKSDNNIDCILKSLNLSKIYFEKFKNNLKWSKVHLNYSFQLPYDECIKEHQLGELNIKVFSSSNFSLPIEFEKYDEFEKMHEAFHLRIENEIKSINNLNSFVKIFKKDRDELQEDIKNNSRKNIELLGIFSAIIALLFQGAYTVNSDVSYENKLFTFIIMFIVLVSFLLMLRAFYSNKYEKDELITIKIISFLVIPLLIISVILLFKTIN